MTQVLIHEASYERIRGHLAAQSIEIQPIIMKPDGSLIADGKPTAVEDIQPDVAWMNLDVFFGPSRNFSIAMLKSQTLKWAQTAAAGVDGSFFSKLAEKGIALTNSDAQAPAIADYVLGFVLEHFQRIDDFKSAQAESNWERIDFREMEGSTWLIIGYGKIGREIAKRVSGFGARVIAVRRKDVPDPLVDETGKLGDITTLLPKADVVVLSCALNDQTRDLAGPAFFDAMKDNSVLVNIGRGGLVDEDALLAALDNGKPEHAILDVFQEEPLPAESPFWSHPRVRVTAHTSAHGSRTGERGDALFIDNLARFISGKQLINEVNPADLLAEK